jgi:hypothetical protein
LDCGSDAENTIRRGIDQPICTCDEGFLDLVATDAFEDVIGYKIPGAVHGFAEGDAELVELAGIHVRVL